MSHERPDHAAGPCPQAVTAATDALTGHLVSDGYRPVALERADAAELAQLALAAATGACRCASP